MMPCCCATNIKAAYVLGIVLTGISLVPVLAWFIPPAIIYGILSALVHGVLIFGTYKRHTIAILVWMVLACLSCIGVAIFAIVFIVENEADEHEWTGFALGIVGSWILVQVWAIKVAYDARKEIEEAGKTVIQENL